MIALVHCLICGRQFGAPDAFAAGVMSHRHVVTAHPKIGFDGIESRTIIGEAGGLTVFQLRRLTPAAAPRVTDERSSRSH